VQTFFCTRGCEYLLLIVILSETKNLVCERSVRCPDASPVALRRESIGQHDNVEYKFIME